LLKRLPFGTKPACDFSKNDEKSSAGNEKCNQFIDDIVITDANKDI